MKTNVRFLTLGLAVAIGTGLVSCSDDETYDIQGANHNLVYISPSASKITNCQIYMTPVGTFGDIKASIPVKMQYRAEEAVRVGAVADTALVSEYNKRNNANAATVPLDVAENIVVEPTEISKDGNTAATNLSITVPEDKKALLIENDYVLPVRLTCETTGGDRKVAASEEMGIHYIAIHNVKKLVSLSQTEKSASIMKTPSGIAGTVSVNYGATLKRAIDSNVSVTLKPATSLVGEYNAKHGTSYEALPEKVASALSYGTTEIKAGGTSGNISVTSGDADFSTLECKTYLLPMQFTATYSNNVVNEAEKDVAYLFVTVEENLIQNNPSSISGKTASDISAWKCMNADNFDPAKMTTSKWVPLEKKPYGEFVIDLGAAHNITGYMKPFCRIGCTGSKVSLSEDGKTWTSTGSTEGKKTVKDANGKECYVFHAGIKARYVKMRVSLDTNSYLWEYLKADWARDYVGVDWNLVFND